MKTIMFIMSILILSVDLFALFQEKVSQQEIEDIIWEIDHYFDKKMLKRTIIIMAGIPFVIEVIYFLYAAMILKKLMYILIITLIIVNLFDRFECVIGFLDTYKINFRQDSIPQYIFTILEIFVISSVILKIFQ